jgi:myo-inositol 2-dehydrogenase / D-chiro-inositol 1-dehydrogenase
MTQTDPIPGAGAGGDTSVGVGLVGAGAIGAFHGESLAWRVPGARLAGVADPAPGAAEGLAARLAAGRPPPIRPSCWPTLGPGGGDRRAARFHAGLVVTAGAGTAMFCEKPVTALRPKPTASQATSA